MTTKETTQTLKHLGKKTKGPITELDKFTSPTYERSFWESARHPSKQQLASITFETSEVTANCPVTGQPDWYNIVIAYTPEEWCIESKSLKLYLQSFRDIGVFSEKLAMDILDRIVTDIEPKCATVLVKQSPRGGVALEAKAEYSKKDYAQL